MTIVNGARQLPLHHITIRVPWHDSGWNGTICNNPCNNTSCLTLSRISASRNDKKESQLIGKSISDLDANQYPPCIDEHGTFMADFNLFQKKKHPYASSSLDTHGHFADTNLMYSAFSAAAVPFRWMLRSQVEGDDKKSIVGKADALQLGWEPEREPKMKFDTSWVQEGHNQQIMLDTFFSAIAPEKSLVFFYAKATPLSDKTRRVIVGIGRVKRVGEITEYDYEYGTPSDALKGYLWERNIHHSIRDNFEDGFLFPYQELLKLYEEDNSIDLEAHVAFAPDDFFEEYSYGSELLPHDGSIASLLECERAVREFKKTMDGPWNQILSWIDKELNRLWEIRGPFPGFGSALTAFGIEHGTLLAWYIYSELEASNELNKINPWDRFEEILKDTSKLPEYLKREVGPTLAKKWEKLSNEKRLLLDLISRCAISEIQATRYYQPTVRLEKGIPLTEKEILANPYEMFEADRLQIDPIQFGAIDRGVFPEEVIRNAFPLTGTALVEEAIDLRRVRALAILALSESQDDGHTLLPNGWIIEKIRNRHLKPSCPVDEDVFQLLDDELGNYLNKAEMANGDNALQLAEFSLTKEIISTATKKRIKGNRHSIDLKWKELVDAAINLPFPEDANELEVENRARTEKASALGEIYQARLSVLVGSAGTGKSTLLKALCNIKSIQDEGILLLAPTGKARVRLEQATNMHKQGKTLAQFLLKYDRYDGSTGRYILNSESEKCAGYKTVIVDECSMLTEYQLAALFESLKNVSRLILVGDPQQLPPIGAGRPFVDIVNFLKNKEASLIFPHVANGYAELTVPRRQIATGDESREDLLLADYFSGRPLDPAADEIWAKLAKGNIDRIELVEWESPADLDGKLISKLVDALELDDDEDEVKFGISIGGTQGKGENVYFNNRYGERVGAAEYCEAWQILSPLRASQLGVDAINRLIQSKFRKRAHDLATQRFRKIPSPMGPQGLLWGDKVINIQNSSRRKTWPKVDGAYVANGDIGIAVGRCNWNKGGKLPKDLQVEFSSQTGADYKSGSPQYSYWQSEFSGETSNPPLELAYALTVHKTQGSEFGVTFLVIPNPCRLLSREMLYTALTRHKNKVVILHQGEFRGIQKYSSQDYSEIARRITNLFINPNPIDIEVEKRRYFLDANLIHKTKKGHRVRSKSELIISDKLFDAGIEYDYEPKVSLNGNERYPDFVIEDDDSGITWYWEHLGMMSDYEYRKRWQKKLEEYKSAGILPESEGGGEKGILITTEEYEGQGFDSQLIDRIIENIRCSDSDLI